MGAFGGATEKHLVLKGTLPWLPAQGEISQAMRPMHLQDKHWSCDVYTKGGAVKVKGKKRELSHSAAYTYDYGYCCGMLWRGDDVHDVVAWLTARHGNKRRG